jgi:sec-independent protein translocase protein TatB
MFNIGAGELAVILVVALIVLGPARLPELARGIGKFMREFRRQTDDVRNMVEREFYRMDQEFQETPSTKPANVPTVPRATAHELPASTDFHEGEYPPEAPALPLAHPEPSHSTASSAATHSDAANAPEARPAPVTSSEAEPSPGEDGAKVRPAPTGSA